MKIYFRLTFLVLAALLLLVDFIVFLYYGVMVDFTITDLILEYFQVSFIIVAMLLCSLILFLLSSLFKE